MTASRRRARPTSCSATERPSTSTGDRSLPHPSRVAPASCIAGTRRQAPSRSSIHQTPGADLASDQLAAVDASHGRRPGDRPGGLGKDSRPDRASSPPDRGPRRGPEHRDRARLQYEGGGRNARAMRQPRDGQGSPHPDAQQHRTVDLQRVRGSRPAERLRGAPGAGPRRRPSSTSLVRRTPTPSFRTLTRFPRSGSGLTSPAIGRGRDPRRPWPRCGIRCVSKGAGRGRRPRFRRADLPVD